MDPNSLLNEIYEGKFSPNAPNHFEEIRRDFVDRISSADGFETAFKNSTSDLERIELIKEHFRWIPIPSDYFARFEKSGETSRVLRERGNSEFKLNQLISAFKGYNLSIAYAPPDSEELGLSFANRSLFFYHIQKGKKALEDIDLALRSSFPKDKVEKLKERRTKCEELINRKSTAPEEGEAELKYFENLFRIKNPHPSLKGAEDFVEIGADESSGRKLIVTQEVPAGTTLILEQPFVTFLNPEVGWDRCHFCTKRILGGVPCHSCTFALFCNEKCLSGALGTFHAFEHILIPYFYSSELIGQTVTATRIVTKVGPERLYSHFRSNSIEEDYNIHQIYNLISHDDSSHSINSISLAFRAYFVAYLLNETSTFFSEVPPEEKDLFLSWIGALIYRFSRSIPFNLMSLTELSSDLDYFTGRIRLDSVISRPLGCALFGLISLCNHSCFPSCTHVKVPWTGLTSILTLRKLNPGEEITISYGPLFNSTLSREDRRSILLEKYRFTCNCPACHMNWPKDLSQIQEDCSGMALNDIKQLEGVKKELYRAQELLNSSKLIEGMRILKNALDFISIHLPSPSFHLQVAQELFKQCLILTIYKANSILMDRND